jgi:hypothetical protein
MFLSFVEIRDISAIFSDYQKKKTLLNFFTSRALPFGLKCEYFYPHCTNSKVGENLVALDDN